MVAKSGRRLGRMGRVFGTSLSEWPDAHGLSGISRTRLARSAGARFEANLMHKHHGDHGRSNKFFETTDSDTDWERPRSKRARAKRRARHRPYEKYTRTRPIDWLDDFDNDS